MQIAWLGHPGFRIRIEQAVLPIDPWLTGNPMFPADLRAGGGGGDPYPADPCTHRPDIGLPAACGFYTTDMKRAACAARRQSNFKTMIPCHDRTFPNACATARAL